MERCSTNFASPSMIGKIIDVLDLFSPECPELGTLEAAERLAWPKSTTSRILGRMEAEGLLDRDAGTGHYRLGIHLARYGEMARRSTSLQRQSRGALEWLVRATQETSSVAVRV